jgi:DNA-binding transcriptional LysR family regulator
MRDIIERDIRRLDGGLLLIFRELLLRRRATDVAMRLGLSQSAISQALRRLRELFQDPLFIRRPHGLEPTQRAIELGPRVDALIDMALATLSSEGDFDPTKSRRQFSITAPDHVISLMGAPLVNTLQAQSPSSSFVSRRVLLSPALALVRRGEVDVAIGQFGDMPPGLSAETLYQEEYCVIARKGHPRIIGAVDIAAYVEIGHIFVGYPLGGTLDETVYDRVEMEGAYGAIPEPGIVSTAAYVAQWETAMHMVASSDAIADCPHRLAAANAEMFNLQVLDPPYETQQFPVRLVCRSNAQDPGVDWFADQIRKILSKSGD